MKKTDVLVIGGSAAGIVAALTGSSSYPEKDFLLIRKEKQVLVPCGIPYLFGSLESSDKNVVSDAGLTKAGINLMIGEIVSIDRQAKICRTADNEEIGFEKLVLATGSTPKIPGWLKGSNLENVFVVPKDKEYLDDMLAKLDNCQKIVIVGGGFIGVEISDELIKRDKEVALVEILPNILSLALDNEFAIQAEEILQSRGVTIKKDAGVKEILGDHKVDGILLNTGGKLEADAVILSMGYSPNTNLAKKSGINVTEKGFIIVDEYMRTENADIFAIGDCVEKRDFITRKRNEIMLASTACAEARIAGMNLYKLSTLKHSAEQLLFSPLL